MGTLDHGGAVKTIPRADKRHWYRRRSAALFLAALVVAVVSSPYIEEFKEGELVEAARVTLILLAGLFAVGGRRRTLLWGMLLALPALIGKWLDHWQPDLVPDWTFLVPGIMFLVYVVGQLLRFIFHSPRVNNEVLCAGLAGYLMLGLLWALAFTLVADLTPTAFAFSTGSESSHLMKGFTALYFSFITLSTVGYGDIAAVSNPARLLAMLEAVTGIFYSTVLIARLVTLYSSEPPEHEPDDQQGL
jgi:hypothetical protein